MHRNVRDRLFSSLAIITLVGAGIYLLLFYMSDNIVFFLAPSEVKNEHINKKIRLGGLVKIGSVDISIASKTIFTLTDNKKEIKVEFKGILPALFREGQGMVAEGMILSSGIMIAERLLTKHDENYKPPIIKDDK